MSLSPLLLCTHCVNILSFQKCIKCLIFHWLTKKFQEISEFHHGTVPKRPTTWAHYSWKERFNSRNTTLNRQPEIGQCTMILYHATPKKLKKNCDEVTVALEKINDERDQIIVKLIFSSRNHAFWRWYTTSKTYERYGWILSFLSWPTILVGS